MFVLGLLLLLPVPVKVLEPQPELVPELVPAPEPERMEARPPRHGVQPTQSWSCRDRRSLAPRHPSAA